MTTTFRTTVFHQDEALVEVKRTVVDELDHLDYVALVRNDDVITVAVEAIPQLIAALLAAAAANKPAVVG